MPLISARPEVRRQGEARSDQGCEDIRRAPDRDSAGPQGTYVRSYILLYYKCIGSIRDTLISRLFLISLFMPWNAARFGRDSYHRLP
jgi:hypothetical protein